jgi:hypothetical protein
MAQEKMNETIAYFQAMIVVGHEIAKLDIGLAGANVIQGDKDAAYRWLERAVERGIPSISLPVTAILFFESPRRGQVSTADYPSQDQS